MSYDVLIGCEESGILREAFRRRGFDAWSCDLKPTARPGPHIQDDVRNHLDKGWRLAVFHPECTFMCNSGVRWLHERRQGRWNMMEQAAEFFLDLWNAPIESICVENPVMHRYAKELIGVQQTQTVQPWWFGDPERKATCLWLKNLPPLVKSNPVLPLGASVHREPPGPERKRNRSRTFPGFAAAMAQQWGDYIRQRELDHATT